MNVHCELYHSYPNILRLETYKNCDSNYSTMADKRIQLGDYIVVQRQNYKKLHKLNKPNSCVSLGRDNVELTGVVGCLNFAFFQLIAKGNKKNRMFTLEPVTEVKDLKETFEISASGIDNRNIIDDGRSQKLSSAEIEELKNEAVSSMDIVGTLISNSNTFHSKTGFSQEKYLRKKEKKYFEYVQIHHPNLRLIHEILFRLDPGKIQHIRMDTLSQVLTWSNISSEGTHLLYDSGSNGLMVAALLTLVGASTSGKLIHLHPGNTSQKLAIQASNFPQEQLGRCISANVYSALRQYYQGCDTHTKDCEVVTESLDTFSRKRACQEENQESEFKIPKLCNESQEGYCSKQNEYIDYLDGNDKKFDEKIDMKDTKFENEKKKPKWHFDTIAAAELLTNGVDSLIITCKEDPLNIFEELIKFVRPSRAFVIHYPIVEPLEKCYLSLKARPDVAALKLTTNWMRNYQVLEDRTHPDVMMNNSSGFLLLGYTLK